MICGSISRTVKIVENSQASALHIRSATIDAISDNNSLTISNKSQKSEE